MSTELKISFDAHRSDSEKKSDRISTLLNTEINLLGSTISDKTKERFYSDLHVLLSSGIDIRTALNIFLSELDKKSDKKHFEHIEKMIVSGAGLSGAMDNIGHFTRYECVSVKIGEESGQLVEVLKELASYFTKRIKMKRQMISVFTYPFFLLVVTFGVLYFMLNNVVPMFAEVFQRFGKELPPFTLKIIGASNFVGRYGFVVIGSILLIVVFFFTQRKKIWYRKASARVLLKIPVFGVLIRKVYLARFCQSMQLLVRAKIPLVESLTLVERMIQFEPLESALLKLKQEIMKGSQLNTEMARHNIFDKRMVSLIKVSEEVNKLDIMFEKLAQQYNEEVEHRTSVMGSLIEPMMILIIGVIVGVILIAMYQPLFNISNILE